MTKILWHSAAPWCATGYGQQTQQATRRLAAAGHDVEISAYFGLEGTKLHWNGILVRPGANDYGDLLLPLYIERYQPELVISLLDVHALSEPEKLKGAPLASWVPIDHQPLGRQIVEFFEASDAIPIAMSRHGQRMLEDAGLDCLYVPHGIDTTTYRPHDRAAAREQLGLPQDVFLIGAVAANGDSSPSRKAWPEIIRAYQQFRQLRPDALLYMHTDLHGQMVGTGVNIPMVAESLGLTHEDFAATPHGIYATGGTPPEQMALLYSAFDVLLAPSYGEGFGLTPLEAQACGVPVIVSDFSAQPELCGAGWKLEGDENDDWWIGSYRAWWRRPRVSAIVAALEDAYQAAGDDDLRAQARAFAETYDADRVFADHWLPTLERLGVRIAAPAAPPLNREQRRALAKAGA